MTTILNNSYLISVYIGGGGKIVHNSVRVFCTRPLRTFVSGFFQILKNLNLWNFMLFLWEIKRPNLYYDIIISM